MAWSGMLVGVAHLVGVRPCVSNLVGTVHWHIKIEGFPGVSDGLYTMATQLMGFAAGGFMLSFIVYISNL